MSDEQDTWFRPFGFDPGAFAATALNEAESAPAPVNDVEWKAPPVLAEDHFPRIPGVTEFDEVEVEPEPEPEKEDPPEAKKEDEKQEPEEQEEDDKGDSPATGNLIEVTLENQSALSDILLTVDDLVASKRIVTQEFVKRGEKAKITIDTDNFGDGMVKWLTQKAEQPDTIKSGIEGSLHDGDNIHLFLQ